MSVVSIQNLKVDFGGKVLFENVSFDVNEGDFVGLIGANGTGKTTLFKVITGELEPTEGGAFVSKQTKVGYLEQHACHGSVRAWRSALTLRAICVTSLSSGKMSFRSGISHKAG